MEGGDYLEKEKNVRRTIATTVCHCVRSQEGKFITFDISINRMFKDEKQATRVLRRIYGDTTICVSSYVTEIHKYVMSFDKFIKLAEKED